MSVLEGSGRKEGLVQLRGWGEGLVSRAWEVQMGDPQRQLWAESSRLEFPTVQVIQGMHPHPHRTTKNKDGLS